MSVSRLAKETGFNRTLLQKYLSGDRLPKTVQESCQLAEALMLSPEKQEELLEQYNRSRYGIRQYDGFLMIRDIVRGLVDYRMQPAYVRESARQSVSPISGEHAGGSGARTAEGAMDALSAREAWRWRMRCAPCCARRLRPMAVGPPTHSPALPRQMFRSFVIRERYRSSPSRKPAVF